MSVLYMGFALSDDLEMKEEMVVQLKEDCREIINNGFDLEPEFDFWPVQHPPEPSHEDRPVQCPIPNSSNLINDERMQDDRFSERKRPEVTEPPPAAAAIRTVRKRHHDHTDTIVPLLQTPPVYPHLQQKMNTSVFNKVHQVHRFEPWNRPRPPPQS